MTDGSTEPPERTGYRKRPGPPDAGAVRDVLLWSAGFDRRRLDVVAPNGAPQGVVP